MFGVTGAGMSKIRNMQNGGKRQRRGLDQWDRVRSLQPHLNILDRTMANDQCSKVDLPGLTDRLTTMIC